MVSHFFPHLYGVGKCFPYFPRLRKNPVYSPGYFVLNRNEGFALFWSISDAKCYHVFWNWLIGFHWIMITINWTSIGLKWTILSKCLEMTFVVIWRFIKETELNVFNCSCLTFTIQYKWDEREDGFNLSKKKRWHTYSRNTRKWVLKMKKRLL